MTSTFLWVSMIISLASNNNGMMSTFADGDFDGMNGVVETNYVDEDNNEDNFNGIRTEIEPQHHTLAVGLNGVMDVIDPQTDSLVSEQRIVKKLVDAPSLKYSFYFPVNVSQLSDNDVKTIQTYVEKWKELQHFTILINGYADPTGSAAYNLQLSQKRALSLKNILLKNGLPSNKIIFQGWGEEEESQDYAHSRRVELIISILQ